MRLGVPLADQPNLPARKLDMLLAIDAAYAEVVQERHATPAPQQAPDGSGAVVVRTPVR